MSVFTHKNQLGEDISDEPRNDDEKREAELIAAIEAEIAGNIAAEIALGRLIAHFHARIEADMYAQRLLAAGESK